jgi:hypothetical protein
MVCFKYIIINILHKSDSKHIIIIIIILIISIIKKRENMHTDKCGNTRRQKCCAKGSGKEVKIEEFMYI